MNRLIFVGDIHGCIDEFQALLKAVRYGQGDRLVLVGDLVAKGPDSQSVVAAARELGVQAVRGNHDQRVVDYGRLRAAGEPLPLMKPHHAQALDALHADDLAYLAALPLWLRFPDENILVVHAGVVPGVPLEQQNPRDLITIRSLKPDGTGSSRLNEGVLWATQWHGPEEIVFGHDAVRGLQHHEHAVGLDSGCCYGRELTAYLLPERRLVSVRAKRVYNEPKIRRPV
jgi:diadenosine tetraphosphatase ApaH/serine/threonine PP2A family protein phosphatase